MIPAVSIIVPVFNTKEYLKQCLQSLLDQSMEDLEIICVDNGSTDSSLKILEEYAGKHENIVVVSHPEGRQGDARNAGLEIAQGQYIGFVDSDDFVDPNMFRKLYDLSLECGAEIAICNIDYFFQKSGEKRKSQRDAVLACDGEYRLLDRPAILRNLTICNKLFSADLIRRLTLRFPEGVFHEDQYFVVLALLNAKAIISTPESLYSYRKERDGSVSIDGGHRAFDIFIVMDMLENEIHSSSEMNDLFRVLRVSRLLQLYDSLKGQNRRDYFYRQKNKFQRMPMITDRSLLTPTEFREYCFVRRNSYLSCELFYCLRRLYGALRR